MVTALPFATTAKLLCPHWAYKTMLFASVVGISPPLAVLASNQLTDLFLFCAA